MLKLLRIIHIILLVMAMVGCKAIKSTQTPLIIESYKEPTQLSYPYPMEQPTILSSNSTYPEPSDDNNTSNNDLTPINTVEQLIISTPSEGKAVITGQLLVGGDKNQPLMTIIYLASATPASTPGSSPLVNLIQQSDPVAIQEVGTGRFIFTDVLPGRYALVVLTIAGEYPLKDSSGNTIIFTVNPGESKDLGVITVQ